MNDIKPVNAQYYDYPSVEDKKRQEYPAYLDVDTSNPDVFIHQKSKKPSTGALALAAATTAAAYQKLKVIGTKLGDGLSSMTSEIISDFNFNSEKIKNDKLKSFIIETANNLKPALKWTTVVLGSLLVFSSVVKDSDEDGELDIVEAAKKFVSPFD